MAELEQLLAPVSEDDAVGPDLAYDADRGTIERAFASSFSADVNGQAAGGDDVDWREIVRLIEDQSAKTKDVWLAVYLCRAGARLGQLDVVVTGSRYLAGLFERYWDNVHPQLEEYGFQGRKGPCEALANQREFLAPLERVVLMEHPRLGRFTGADFMRFRARAESEEGYPLFRAALNETADETLQETVARLDEMQGAIRESDAALVAHAEGETGANFQPTYDLIDQLKRAVAAFMTAPPADVSESVDADAEGVQAGAPAAEAGAGGPRIAGRVETREDVIKALDAVADYYRRREPASPVPVLLQRAREWVSLDFLALIEDIAPGGLDEAKKVLVSQRKAGGESGW